MKTPLHTAICLVLSLAPLASAHAVTFEVLPASGDFVGMGKVGAISSDGATIAAAGWSLSTWGPQGVKWTPTTGAKELDATLPQLGGGAWGVSADGTVLAGWRFNSSGKAVCWVNGTLRSLTAFRNSAANDVSRDGVTAVGRNPTSEKSSYYPVAAKWNVSSLTATSLGDLAGGGTQSEATKISADGTTIVGWGTSATGILAFRAVGGAAMASIGELPGGRIFSEALGVSANGTVVVGRSESANGMEAFRWTSGAGMTGLGDFPGGAFQSLATGVSGDGGIVVGTGATEQADNQVFVWNSTGGMRSLTALCSMAGTPLSGYRFTYCRPVISEDGDSIAGDAIAPDQTQVLWRLTGLRGILDNSAAPTPRVQLELTAEGIALRFVTEAGFRYQVQQSTDLSAGGWTNVGSPIVGDGSEHAEPAPFNSPSCFYRLVVSSAKP